jgi:hypothetical protein
MKNPKLFERLARFGLWMLIFAVSFWSFNRNEWIEQALADYTITYVDYTYTSTMVDASGVPHLVPHYHTATKTITSSSTSTDTSSGPHTSTGSTTDTNCVTGGSQYGGGQWNYCNRSDPTQQKNSQKDTNDLNNNGADQSTALGMAAIAAGMAMVAAGMALLPNPPTTPAGIALIAAGMALIAAGMAALAAAGQMNKNANKAGNNAANLDNLASPYQSTISTAPGSTDNTTSSSAIGDGGNSDVGNGNGSGIKIDPALLRSGKMDSIFSDMEKKTGLNRDDMAKALAGGGDPLNMLANSPALAGKPGGSEANLQKMMDDTKAKGNIPDANAVMDKLGLSKDDLVANAGGSDPNRSVASNAAPNIDALFPGADKPPTTSGGPSMGLSPEVQAALDKNGITGRTIFQMVHAQYLKKTPQMFGVQKEKDGTANNPYTNLGGDKDKVDL